MNMPNSKNWLPRIFIRNRITKEDYEQIKDETTPPPPLNVSFADSRRIIMAGLIIIGLFFGVGGAWISLAQISGAVIASGEVRVDTERKTVQHLEGGIIRDILVRNGDTVEAGQPLIVLDNSRIVAQTDQLKLRHAAAHLAEIRLQAEKALSAQVEWPQGNLDIPQDKFVELHDSARKVFSSGRETLKNQVAMLNKQIDQVHQQDLSLDGRLQAEQEIVATLQEELDAKMVLFEQQYIDKTRILELRRAIAEHQGVQAQLRGSQAELRERVGELQLRSSATRNEYRQKAVQQQEEMQQRLFDLQQQLLPLIDARQRLTITSPVSGEIVAMQVHSIGGVVKPGEPLLDIVPHDSPLIVECHIMVKDINHVHEGQEADVQLLAFDRTAPKVLGHVVYLSADRVMQRTAYGDQPAYVAHIELDKQQLKENNLFISAGMPAVVFIRSAPRTVLEYALDPLTAGFDRALREN